MTEYSPETQAILDAVAAGDVCPECGAANHLRHFDECPRHPENQEAADVPSPRTPMLAVVERLTAIAGDARRDAGVARADGDQERRQYLFGEHRGLMEAAEVMLAFDWTTAWREAMTITSVEQLEVLPAGAVVRSPGQPDEFPELGMQGAGSWTRSDDDYRPWFWWAMDYGEPASAVPLPAVLLWHPDWSKR